MIFVFYPFLLSLLKFDQTWINSTKVGHFSKRVKIPHNIKTRTGTPFYKEVQYFQKKDFLTRFDQFSVSRHLGDNSAHFRLLPLLLDVKQQKKQVKICEKWGTFPDGNLPGKNWLFSQKGQK